MENFVILHKMWVQKILHIINGIIFLSDVLHMHLCVYYNSWKIIRKNSNLSLTKSLPK
jgi:hypothetical protein